MSGSIYSVQYCDAHSILIVNSRGVLRLLYTPFKVVCRIGIGRYKAGVHAFVEEVVAGEKDELIYIIGEGAYHHGHFLIVANF